MAAKDGQLPSATEYRDFGWGTDLPFTLRYLLPPVLELCGPLAGKRVLDAGCGNGAYAGQLAKRGCKVVGIDLGESGLAVAKAAYPQVRFERLPVDEHILENLGEPPFDLVLSTEVIEHIYAPHPFVRACFGALRPGGLLVMTTPYHGFIKNVAIALSGKFDAHVNPLIHGGHIKFWSLRTITKLMNDAGFEVTGFRGAGRVPFLWKSMVIAAKKPD